MTKLSLPDISETKVTHSRLEWKKMVKKSIQNTFEDILKSKIAGQSMLKEGPLGSENVEEKSCLTEMTMFDAGNYSELEA